MKFILPILASLTLQSQMAFAQLETADTAAPQAMATDGLKATMKLMSHEMKTIDSQVDDATKNKSSAEAADRFAADAVNAKSFTPDAIDKMPTADRAAAKKQYADLLDQVAAAGLSLAKAFRADDNAKAKQILADLDQLKKQGHGIFK